MSQNQSDFSKTIRNHYILRYMFEPCEKARLFLECRIKEMYGGAMPELNLAVDETGALVVNIHILPGTYSNSR